LSGPGLTEGQIENFINLRNVPIFSIIDANTYHKLRKTKKPIVFVFGTVGTQLKEETLNEFKEIARSGVFNAIFGQFEDGPREREYILSVQNINLN